MMRYSNFKFILFSIMLSWFLTGCDGEMTITTRDGSDDVSARVTLESNLTNISNNGSVTLTWLVDNASNCVAIGDWSGSKSVTGSEVIDQLSEDSTFTLSCMSEATEVSDTVIVYVGDVVVPTLTFSASSSSVNMNSSTSLSWSSTDATECTASGDWSGIKGTSGSETISAISSDSQYVLDCSGPGGSVNDTVDVTVITTPIPTISLSSSPSTVSEGGSTILSWNSTNATSCTASGDWSGAKGATGAETINSITNNSQFILDCSGTGGSASASVNVAVVMSNNGTALLSWTPPTENTDGSTLTDLVGYRVYYGTQPGNYTESVEIANPGLASYLIENLAPASWYFVMTSYNTANIESAYSEEVSKVIN